MATFISIVASLQSARMSVFWPGISAEVKNYIQTCDTCNRLLPNKQRKEPRKTNQAGHGPSWLSTFSLSLNTIFPITTDYWSNSFEIDELRETTSRKVLRCLRRHFATHGISQELVADNGPQFRTCDLQASPNTWIFTYTTTRVHITVKQIVWLRVLLKQPRRFWKQRWPKVKMLGWEFWHIGTQPIKEETLPQALSVQSSDTDCATDKEWLTSARCIPQRKRETWYGAEAHPSKSKVTFELLGKPRSFWRQVTKCGFVRKLQWGHRQMHDQKQL